MDRDPAFEDWVNEARRASLLKVCAALPGAAHVSAKSCTNVPCPGCGGTDRFSINRQKNIFFCRFSRAAGDAIALVQHVTGCNFLEAVEQITGSPPPGRTVSEAEKCERRERLARIEAERAAEAARIEAEHNDFRDKEVRRAHDIWRKGRPIAGTLAEAYLARRGVAAPANAALRFLADAKYWHNIGGQFRQIHEGPALLAMISGPDGGFMGCHMTFIDLATPKGKAEVVHPTTGEVLVAKKVRGSKKGGHILLGGEGRCETLIIGEGIETVLRVRNALAGDGWPMADTWWWTSVDLGNMGGKARDRVRHPSATLTDARGRVRAVMVAGPTPDPASPALLAPGSANSIVLLGDGDSDRLTTENVLRRFAARNARPGRTIRWAWADQGHDFGDMEEAGEEVAA